MTYEDFIKSPPAARGELFQRLNAESKALIQRTHAVRWLAANRAGLTAVQIAAANEAIEFVTPRIHQQPTDPGILERGERIKQKLACTLGHDNVRQAFVVDALPLAREGSTWWSVLDEWLSWFSECVAG
jgi:hypothetical protein